MSRTAARLAAAVVLLLAAACQPGRFSVSDQAAETTPVSVEVPAGSGGIVLDPVAAMAELKVPSVSVALIEDGAVAWVKAWGADTTVATPYQAASMSKPVAAAAALALVDQGYLTLDDDIGRWIPKWHVDLPGHPVTLRGLLSMTAGINVPGFEGYAPGAPLPDLEQILGGQNPANSEQLAIKGLPGTAYAYSGGGYVIVEVAMQGATGDDFGELARSLVLVPSGMTSSAFEQPPGDTLALIAARGHDGEGAEIAGGWHVNPERAAAGLWATPGDLARFLVSLDRSWRGEDGILSQPIVQVMFQPQNGGPYGLGFAVVGKGRSLALHKRGQNPGYQGYMILFPATGQGAVVMTGSDNGAVLAEGILRRLGEVYGWPWDGQLAD